MRLHDVLVYSKVDGEMSVLELVLSTWILLTAFLMALAIILGMFKIRREGKCQPLEESEQPLPRLEVLVPVKGVSPNQDEILKSLLTQNYPSYHLSFILEDEQDEANELVERLCNQYVHAHKVLSGSAKSCAQKNHNLIAGVKALRPETEVIVFCDSTNMADSDWLRRFIMPLVANGMQVVTTFRAFKPEPATIGGVSQAIYAALLRILATMRPTPWGGATALRRSTFDRLEVVDLWSHTVVDDLVLGNILEASGVTVTMDPCNLLVSPVHNQSVAGFLAYMDRQILFPKFTNPGIWLAAVASVLNLALAFFAAAILGTLSIAGMAAAGAGWASYSFLLVLLLSGLLLRNINPTDISLKKWLVCLVPCIILVAFIGLRSIIVNHIDWHGRRYWPGKGGVVLRLEWL